MIRYISYSDSIGISTDNIILNPVFVKQFSSVFSVTSGNKPWCTCIFSFPEFVQCQMKNSGIGVLKSGRINRIAFAPFGTLIRRAAAMGAGIPARSTCAHISGPPFWNGSSRDSGRTGPLRQTDRKPIRAWRRRPTRSAASASPAWRQVRPGNIPCSRGS